MEEVLSVVLDKNELGFQDEQHEKACFENLSQSNFR